MWGNSLLSGFIDMHAVSPLLQQMVGQVLLELPSFVTTSVDTYRFWLPCCRIRGPTSGAVTPDMSLSLDVQCRFTESNSTTENDEPINEREDRAFRMCTNLPSGPPGLLVLQVTSPKHGTVV